MFCVRCGNKLDDGDRFCPQCGEPVAVQIEDGSSSGPAGTPQQGVSHDGASNESETRHLHGVDQAGHTPVAAPSHIGEAGRKSRFPLLVGMALVLALVTGAVIVTLVLGQQPRQSSGMDTAAQSAQSSMSSQADTQTTASSQASGDISSSSAQLAGAEEGTEPAAEQATEPSSAPAPEPAPEPELTEEQRVIESLNGWWYTNSLPGGAVAPCVLSYYSDGIVVNIPAAEDLTPYGTDSPDVYPIDSVTRSVQTFDGPMGDYNNYVGQEGYIVEMNGVGYWLFDSNPDALISAGTVMGTHYRIADPDTLAMIESNVNYDFLNRFIDTVRSQ